MHFLCVLNLMDTLRLPRRPPTPCMYRNAGICPRTRINLHPVRRSRRYYLAWVYVAQSPPHHGVFSAIPASTSRQGQIVVGTSPSKSASHERSSVEIPVILRVLWLYSSHMFLISLYSLKYLLDITSLFAHAFLFTFSLPISYAYQSIFSHRIF
ncbi:hypothetical protein F4678DRAFT_131203 [Xylaria arbuscula]|nr:hypothetical protein F4678DRAFT_131203 [Xylaria arbuscula]